MGAKFTIVLDTDDPQGLRDALEVARLLNKNHQTQSGVNIKAKIRKIELIKLVREAAKKVEEGKMDSSLRHTKDFVDAKWGELIYKDYEG
jgi:hypothetical protein